MGIVGNEGADAQANLGCELPEVPELDWEAKLEEVLRRKGNNNAVHKTTVSAAAPPSNTTNVLKPAKHGATVVLAAPGKDSTSAQVAESSSRKSRIAQAIEETLKTPPREGPPSSSRFKPATTTTNAKVTSSSRQQRIEQAIEESMRSSPPSDHASPAPAPALAPAAPITPTKPLPRAAAPATTTPGDASRLAAYTPTRVPRNGAAGGVSATAAARAPYTDPRRDHDDVESPPRAGPSTSSFVASLPTRRRGRYQEPTFRDVGVEAKLCDCCRNGMHRSSQNQARKRSASPPPRRDRAAPAPVPNGTNPKRGGNSKPGTQESTKSVGRTQPLSITESDLNVRRAVFYSAVCSFLITSCLWLWLFSFAGVRRRLVG